MSLAEQLRAIKDKARERIPPAAWAIMERAVEDQRRSGALEQVVKIGQRAPDFTLPDAAGSKVHLADLLAHGPVVLSFFRGRW
jgi:AhpC/TSA family protein